MKPSTTFQNSTNGEGIKSNLVADNIEIKEKQEKLNGERQRRIYSQICGDLASFPDDDPKKGGLQVMFRLDYNRSKIDVH